MISLPWLSLSHILSLSLIPTIICAHIFLLQRLSNQVLRSSIQLKKKMKMRTHWGSIGFSPKVVAWVESLQVPSESKILIFFFFWLLGRERLLAFFQDMLADPSSTQSLSHLVCFILLKERCSPTLILFQRATLSQPQQPCQERKDERLEHELP
uniref:Uncharacterized protein n=1 Tax=Ursus americanus TaxID=9643 RepID=A0A452RPG8_URSAM